MFLLGVAKDIFVAVVIAGLGAAVVKAVDIGVDELRERRQRPGDDEPGPGGRKA